MSLSRIYYPELITIGDTITLNVAASHHLLQVLKLRVGETLLLFNETGEYQAKLEQAGRKQATVFIESQRSSPSSTESPLHIHLGQVISRGERMDYVIQKAVELGVTAITPLFSERCGVKLQDDRLETRVAHWQAIAVHASEQSGRCSIATIQTPQPMDKWLKVAPGLRLICTPHLPPNVKSTSKPDQVSLLIGPEGGFSNTEIQLAEQAGFHPFSLGPRVLRTETAPIVALALLQNWYGDL